jgi:CBS domain-containing protein
MVITECFLWFTLWVKSMTAFVQSLTKRKCLTVLATTSLEEVVRVLARNSIGALVVVSKNGKIEGIVSERDIVRRLSWSVTINDLTASDVMTKDVISVTTNVTSSDLMQVMTENKCRHLPIVSGSRLVGMVSIGDVVKRLLEKYNTEVEQMRSFINS